MNTVRENVNTAHLRYDVNAHVLVCKPQANARFRSSFSLLTTCLQQTARVARPAAPKQTTYRKASHVTCASSSAGPRSPYVEYVPKTHYTFLCGQVPHIQSLISSVRRATSLRNANEKTPCSQRRVAPHHPKCYERWPRRLHSSWSCGRPPMTQNSQR